MHVNIVNGLSTQMYNLSDIRSRDESLSGVIARIAATVSVVEVSVLVSQSPKNIARTELGIGIMYAREAWGIVGIETKL